MERAGERDTIINGDHRNGQSSCHSVCVCLVSQSERGCSSQELKESLPPSLPSSFINHNNRAERGARETKETE